MDTNPTYCVNGHDLTQTSRLRKSGRTQCSACQVLYAKRNTHKQRESGNLAKTVRKYQLKRKYGITIGEFEKLLEEQSFRCAICRTDDWGRHNKPHIDHDHKTGRVRGLLCSRCNMGLGMFLDNPARLSSAIAYLSHHTDWRGS